MEENNKLSDHFNYTEPKKRSFKLLKLLIIFGLLGGGGYAFLKYDGMQYLQKAKNNYRSGPVKDSIQKIKEDTLNKQLFLDKADSINTNLPINSNQDSSLSQEKKLPGINSIESDGKKSIFDFNKNYNLDKAKEIDVNKFTFEQKKGFPIDNNFQKFVIEKGNELFLKNQNKSIISYSSYLNIVSLLAKQALEDNYCNDVTRSIFKSFVSNENVSLIAIITNEGQILYATDANFKYYKPNTETQKVETFYEEDKIVTKLPLYQAYGRIGEVIIKTKEKE